MTLGKPEFFSLLVIDLLVEVFEIDLISFKTAELKILENLLVRDRN